MEDKLVGGFILLPLLVIYYPAYHRYHSQNINRI